MSNTICYSKYYFYTFFFIALSLHCYECASDISIDDCATRQSSRICGSDQNKCASMSYKYYDKIVYRKKCVHRTLSCEDLCITTPCFVSWFKKNLSEREILDKDALRTKFSALWLDIKNINLLVSQKSIKAALINA